MLEKDNEYLDSNINTSKDNFFIRLLVKLYVNFTGIQENKVVFIVIIICSYVIFFIDL